VRPVGGLFNLGVLYLSRPFVAFVMTTDANDQLRGIHRRQPLIVEDRDLDVWLDRFVSLDSVTGLVRRYDGEFVVG
jgi:putative SOS response-associated peptidase YedK